MSNMSVCMDSASEVLEVEGASKTNVEAQLSPNVLPDIIINRDEGQELIKLKVYDIDQDQTHKDEIHVIKADEVIFKSKWRTIYHDRWENVPAGYETKEARVIVFKRDGQIYLLVQYKYEYSLDNGLQEEYKAWYEVYPLTKLTPRILETLIKVVKDEKD